MNQLATNSNQDNIEMKQDEEGYTAGSNSQQNRMLRIFGGIQITLGVVSGILSFVGLILDGININMNCDFTDHWYITRCLKHWNAPFMFILDSICLIFSGWSILTGAFPFCMTAKRRNRWRCLKITFMVCSIVGASVFAPTAFGMGVTAAYYRANDTGAIAAIPSFVALISFAELVVAIVASSYCCCCSDWSMYERARIVYVTTTQSGVVTSMSESQMPNQRQLPNTTTYTQPGMYRSGITEQQNRSETSIVDRVTPAPAYTTRNMMTPNNIDDDLICLLDSDLL